MMNFFKSLLRHKNTSQQVNNNANTTVIQVAGDYYHAQQVNESAAYISKRGKDIEPVELLTTRADIEQGFNPYFYLTRSNIDGTLLKRLAHYKSAILIGKPLAGKTRSIFQLTKNELANYLFFIPTDTFSVEKAIELPSNSTEKSIIIFDDIDNYVSNNDMQKLAKYLKKILQQNAVVATCQKAKFEEVELFLQENNLMELFQVIEIPPLSIEHKKQIAQKTNKSITEGDDTVGSFILPIEKMKALYKTLPLLEKEILRSYKFLKFISKTNFISQIDIQSYCDNRLLKHYNKNLIDYTFAIWEEAFSTLENLGFILKKEAHIAIEEIYLYTIIEPSATERITAFELTSYMPDVFTYSKVIHKVSNYSLAKEIFDRQIKNNIKPNEVTFNTLMNKVSEYQQGIEVLHNMKPANIKPDEVTFNTLMNKVSEYQQGIEVLHNMKQANIKPDVVTFNTLMNKVSEYQQGIEVLHNMKPANIKPDDVTFTTLMNKVSEYQQGIEVLHNMKQANIKPDVVTFTTLMNKASEYQQGIEVLHDMKQINIKPNEVTFNTLMNKVSEYQQGIEVLHNMKQANIKPDVVTFNTLMNKVSEYQQGIEVLHNMKQANIKPDDVTFTTLMNKVSEYQQGIEVLHNMKQANIKPDVVTFNTLMNKVSEYQQGIEVLHNMKQINIKPDVVTFNTLMNKVSEYQQGIEVLHNMKQANIKPDVVTFTTLMNKVSEYQQGIEVLHNMKQANIKPDVVTFNTIKSKIDLKKSNLVINSILAIKDIKTVFEDETLNAVIGYLLPHIDYQTFLKKYEPYILTRDKTILHYGYILGKINQKEAYELALSLIQHIKVQDDNYFNLMGNCIKQEDLHQAIELYKSAIEFTENNTKKAKYCNNIGLAILNSSDESFYKIGIDYCKKAIILDKNQQYAKENLIFLVAKDSSLEELLDNLLSLIKKMRTNKFNSLRKTMQKLNINNKAEKAKIQLIQEYLLRSDSLQ